MTARTLILRSLRFHARSHLGVWLGALVSSAVLIGALVVGESVRGSLRDRALARVGGVQIALDSGDRLFGADLYARLERVRVPSGNPAERRFFSWPGRANGSTSLLHLKGTAAKQDGSARANEVHIYGVTPDFWAYSTAAEKVREQLEQEKRLIESSNSLARELSIQNLLKQSIPSSSGNVPTNNAAAVELQLRRIFQARVQTTAGNLYSVRGLAPTQIDPGKVRVNTALAEQLQAKVGDSVVLRFRKPSALPQDAVLGSQDNSTIALRANIDAIVDAPRFGDFSLTANQRPPLNVFVNRGDLGRLSGTTDRANLLIVRGGRVGRNQGNQPDFAWKLMDWMTRKTPWLPPQIPAFLARISRRSLPPESLADTGVTAQHVSSQLRKQWRLSDSQIEVRVIEQPESATGGEPIAPMVEVATPRIFLDPIVATAALRPRTTLITNRVEFANDRSEDLAEANYVTNGVPLITYLVNAIRSQGGLTPYSMVTAVGSPWTPLDMHDDEIIINEWLAKDLGLKPGDPLELSYYDPATGSSLVEDTNRFTVRAIVPMRGLHADRTLMPEFPGVAAAESTGDWDTGFQLVHKIRDQDEAYWKQYRGTPKAFITLNAGRKMWANRFGEYTAVRYLVPTNGFPSPYKRIVEANLVAKLDPSQLGLVFQPVRDQALKAAEQSQDFGGLFIGFSFFLIVAALLLMAMLFTFGVEQRTAEIGTLLALGFLPKRVRRMFLIEGIMIAVLGALAGTAAGVLYAKGMLWGLTTIWRSAVGTSVLALHNSWPTLLGGAVGSVLVAALAIWLALRKQAGQPARELLAEGAEERESRIEDTGRSSRWNTVLGIVSALGAFALVGFGLASEQTSNPGLFFAAGALLLVAGLLMSGALLRKLRTRASVMPSLNDLSFRNAARRRKRSLAVIGSLACGSFLIASIGAFRLDANADATKRSSGTGGFAFIGQSTLPIVKDLNTEAGLDHYGFDAKELAGVRFVPFRVREGDEASCLNLNRAQQPRLLGVKPEMLSERKAFTFAKVTQGLSKEDPWLLLNQPQTDGSVPAIGDAASIQWALGKKVGDTIDYTDERGQPFKAKLVGAVANSILQGHMIIAEDEFTKRFPSGGGYRMFLIDAPSNDALSATLTRALQDVGFELTRATVRLAQFNAVQNTYLNTFQVLGGLGLLLGSAGLGVVVLRNVLERRGELALLLAVGFRRRTVKWTVVNEHGALLLAGLGIGVLAALVAVLPALLTPGGEFPYGSLALTLGAVLASGAVWTWVAASLALRGRLLDALRNE